VRALVIGGTGPTGHFIVAGLRRRGFAVTILHTGRHEIPEIPEDVVHLHVDPFDSEALNAALSLQTFDLCVATYGRLRRIAQLLAGKVGRFISIGGVPAYRGYMNPWLLDPHGLPVPIAEGADLVRSPEEDAKGWRIVRTEEEVFANHPSATHFRYPYVYGPYQALPREWCIVRRILDRRPHLILPDGGLTLHSFGYAENLAHAVLLAVDQPDRAAGQIYNCSDEEVLTLRQVVEIIAKALDHTWEVVSMPWALAIPARPLVMVPLPTHRVLDIGKLKRELGYHDVVAPAQALAHTAQWLVAHPPQKGGVEEFALTDPFDYAAEDRLIAAWKTALAQMPEVRFEVEPGYSLSYSGPGGRPRSSAFE